MNDSNGNAPLKLNIGSGDSVVMKGYVNVDAKFGDTAYPLKYGDNCVDEIYASHILEHFSQHETVNVLKDWARALKPGGVLKIAVPHFDWIVKEYSRGNPDRLPLSGYLMGGQTDENDYHKAIFNEATLRVMFRYAGLVDVQPWKSEVKDCASLPVSLNLMGRKPEAEPNNLMRVYDLAKELKAESRKIVEEAKSLGADVASPSSRLSVEVAHKIRGLHPLKKDMEVASGLPRCTHGAIIGRASEPFAGGMAQCECCKSSFGSFQTGPRFCSRCITAYVKQSQEIKPVNEVKANENGKYFVAGQWREEGDAPGQVKLEQVQVGPIGLATSTPRYGSLIASDNMWQCAIAMGAQPARSGGAWWEQGLSRQIEKLLEQGTQRGPVEFFFTVDFDSYMNPEDGLNLLRLMYENPQLDCIVPMQVRRGMFEEVLAQTDGPVTITDPLVPIVHGHFGFTLFRRRVFERMSTPWMLNVPDPQGRWNEGRTDADIYFWHKFCDEGFKAAMSTQVIIGHGDEGVCWPKLVDGKWVKVWQSVFEWIQTRKPPEGIIAK